MKTLFLGIFWGVLIFIVLALVGVYIFSGPNTNSLDNNNFDGSYNISYSNDECGELGYQFKLKHQKDGYSSVSNMNKSNCKKYSYEGLEGYIYPKSKPNLRVFWIYTSGVLIYK